MVGQCGLGQEREDATTVVVHDHEHHREPTLVHPEQSVAVVEEAEVTTEGDGRYITARGNAERGRHEAVDPVHPAVRVHVHPEAWCGEGLQVADRHARRHDEVGPFGETGHHIARDPAFEQLVGTVEHGIDPRAQVVLGVLPRDEPTVVGPTVERTETVEAVGERVQERLTIGHDHVDRGATRIAPPSIRVDEEGRHRAQPAGGRLPRERRTELHDQIGPESIGENGIARDRVVRRHHTRPGPQAGHRVREDRPACGRRAPSHGLDRHSGAPPGRHHALRAREDASCNAVQVSGFDDSCRPRATLAHGAPSARPGASTSGAPVGTSGSRNARFRCTGPGGVPSVSATRADASARQRAPLPARSVGGSTSQNHRGDRP